MEQPKNNFKIVSDKKARMLLPNTLTLINICIGLSSIKFALDDKFDLRVRIRIVGQIIVASLMIYGVGDSISNLGNLFGLGDSVSQSEKR